MSFEKQITFPDKYFSIFFLSQMKASVFFKTHAFGEHSWVFPSFSLGMFGHVTLLDQLCKSEKKCKFIMISSSSHKASNNVIGTK